MEPGPWTLRELIWAADGRRRDAWDRASVVMALLANQNQTRRANLRHPRDYHPYHARRRPRRLTADRIDDLKVFLPDAERRGI